MKNLTELQQVSLMQALGCDVGSSFGFEYEPNLRFEMLLTPKGIQLSGRKPSDAELGIYLVRWMLAGFGKKELRRGVGLSETPSAAEQSLVESMAALLANPVFMEPDLESLVPRVTAAFRSFYRLYNKTQQ